VNRIKARLHQAAHDGLRRLGYDLNRYPGDDFDPELLRIIKQVRPYTVTSVARLYALHEAVRYLVRAHIPGAIVECGVWRGGSMMAAAYSLIEAGDTSRDLYLFDTYEGMVAPTDADVRIDGADAATLMAREAPSTDAGSIWKVAGLEDVRTNMARTGYPVGLMHFVEGRIEDTVPRAAPETISLLRLDTDWYESTRHEMEHLYPRLSPGGILILDDYGHWGGARKAVDEYVEAHDLRLFLQRVDDTGRLVLNLLPPSAS